MLLKKTKKYLKIPTIKIKIKTIINNNNNNN